MNQLSNIPRWDVHSHLKVSDLVQDTTIKGVKEIESKNERQA